MCEYRWHFREGICGWYWRAEGEDPEWVKWKHSLQLFHWQGQLHKYLSGHSLQPLTWHGQQHITLSPLTPFTSTIFTNIHHQYSPICTNIYHQYSPIFITLSGWGSSGDQWYNCTRVFQHCQRTEQVNIFNIVNECFNIVNKLFNIVNNDFNIVNELSRSPPQPKPEGLDDKCLVQIEDKI